MNDRDAFAVWIATSVLQGTDDEFGAEALSAAARQTTASGGLDTQLRKAEGDRTRPGDMGLEIVGPALLPILVEFGRTLWDAYVKQLAEAGGKSLADATLAAIKNLARRTWSYPADSLPLDEVERTLRAAATRAKLDSAETERLIAGLRSPAAAQSVAGA